MPPADGDRNDTQLSGLDLENLRKKYAAERARRLNPKQDKQWLDLKDELSRFGDDPYVEPGFQRAPVRAEVDVVIVGGGFGGLLSAVGLRKRGIDNLFIVEKSGDFGGTWYWNRYPGCQCDVESYIYVPLLEETGYIPTMKYAYAPEIMEHAQRIGRHFNLYERALFQTQVLEMRWNEHERRWDITTDRGDLLNARFVMSASGPLNRPHLPDISGIRNFKGQAFHTSRWDYRYTGGNSAGGMTGLADKRVAVIGTGATAVQCVPYVAQDAKHLYVLQRTPSYVWERGNRPTDPNWAKSLTPGWQLERAGNFDAIIEGEPTDRNLVDDGWTLMRRTATQKIFAEGADLAPEAIMARVELADFDSGVAMRSRIDQIVTNKSAAEGLKPWFRGACKRPCMNDEYYPAFNRPNVTLVDTLGKGVERITERGLVANGVEYEVDCIIFATGFDTGAEYTKRADLEIYGVGGRTLTEHHRDEPRTYHGFYSQGFPNLFFLGISQNGFKANFTHMLLEQTRHILDIVAVMAKRGNTRIEPSAQAEEEWQQTIRMRTRDRKAVLAACTPGYYNGQGDVNRGLLANVYGGGAAPGAREFSQLMEQWLADGDMKGLQIS